MAKDDRDRPVIIDPAGTGTGADDQELAKPRAFVGQAQGIDATVSKNWSAAGKWNHLEKCSTPSATQRRLALELSTSCSSPRSIRSSFWEASTTRSPGRQGDRAVAARPALAEALAEAGIKPFHVQPLIPYLKRVDSPAERILPISPLGRRRSSKLQRYSDA